MPGRLVFMTSADGSDSPTERMRIDSSGTVLLSGSRNGNAISDATLRFNIVNSSGDEKKAQIISTKVADISSTIEFGTTVSHAYAERMRIHSDGNVGIGTTSPSRKLEINSGIFDVVAKFVSSDSAATINLVDGLNADGVTIGSINGNMTFRSGLSTERMRITSDGPHLLLGGTSDVNEITESSANAGMVIGGTGFGNAGLAIITSTSGTGRLYFGDDVGGNAGRNRGQINYGHSDDHMRFVTASGERMRINSIGNVGIGTSNPGQRLEVRQTSASHAIIACNRPNSDTFAVALGNNSSNNGVISVNNSDLIFGRDNSGTFTERFRMTNDGRVSFNNSSPPTGVSGAITFVGFTSRNGRDGSNTGNLHNFQWTGSALNAFVDNTNMGEIRNSASDYRIKRNIQTQTESGIDKIKQLRCVTYSPADYTVEEGTSWSVASDEVKEGFIAHEVAAVIPSGVSGAKDDPNRIQQLNIDAIVSVLTKALQEEVVKREALEARIAALEAA
jgi:hypothetical protein